MVNVKATWMIEHWESRFDDVTRLCNSCSKQDVSFCVFNLEQAYGPDFIPASGKEGCYVFFGSIGVAKRVEKETVWVPGTFRTCGHYMCSWYYPRLETLALNAGNYMMIPYGDLQRSKKLLFRALAEDGAVFIRPDSNDKEFTGKLVFDEDFEKDVGLMGFYDVPPELMCVVAAPVNIENEWRFVMVDGKPLTGSQYRAGRKVEYVAYYPPEAWDVAVQAGEKIQPDRVWVCDVCETKSGHFYVLEIGSFSNCGLYQCDTDVIVEHVSRVALEEWEAAQA